MAKTTGEDILKMEVKRLLRAYHIQSAAEAPGVVDHPTGWYFMPVPVGYGVSGIPDFIGCYKGVFWAVETKVEPNKPSAYQKKQRKLMEACGAYHLTAYHAWQVDAMLKQIDKFGVKFDG